MNINLYINKQSARAEAPEIFSGSVGVLTVTLFGELDSSLVTALRFMHESGDGYYTAALENGSAVVPHEVIKAPGFSIAVAGYENDGDTVVRFLPSEAVYIPVKENGYGNPDDAVSEEGEAKSLIGQILSECTETREEALLAQEKLSQSYKSEQEKLSQSYNTAAIVLEEKCNENKAYIDEKSEELTNNLSSEKTQRETADDDLLLRISEEEEAREAADSELEERIINTERGIAAVRDELEADIKDNLSGYVKKEDGKGLSTASNVWVNGTWYDDNYECNELHIVYHDNTEDVQTFYTVEQMKELLANKVIEGIEEIDIDALTPACENGLKFYKVLPQSEDNAYYLINSIPESGSAVGNVACFQMRFKENIERRNYVEDTDSWTDWEIISGGADLSGYVKNTDYATADKAGVVKVSGNDGIKVNSSGLLYITQASYDTIDAKQSKYYPITPFVLDYAVQACTNQDMNAELTEQQQKLPPSTASVKAYIEETLLGGAW